MAPAQNLSPPPETVPILLGSCPTEGASRGIVRPGGMRCSREATVAGRGSRRGFRRPGHEPGPAGHQSTAKEPSENRARGPGGAGWRCIDAFDIDIDIDIRHAAVDRDAARTPRIPSDRDDPKTPRPSHRTEKWNPLFGKLRCDGPWIHDPTGVSVQASSPRGGEADGYARQPRFSRKDGQRPPRLSASSARPNPRVAERRSRKRRREET